MALYKIIQDVEAEDKLLGPLTLKQFIYAAVGVINLYLSFLVLTKGVALLLIVFLPVALVAIFLAWPWSLNQPTEVWALAKVRFILKPHLRIWNQSGVNERVTITAPKTLETNFTNNLSQTEVRSRLQSLAELIDSRGWAVKNVNVNLSTRPIPAPSLNGSDRLIDPTSFPQDVPNVDIQASDDILDEINNPVAQHVSQMITASNQTRRQKILQQLRGAAVDTPATNQTPATTDSTALEAMIDQELKSHSEPVKLASMHMRTIQPLSHTAPVSPLKSSPAPSSTGIPPVPSEEWAAAPLTTTPTPAITTQNQVTPVSDPDIIMLANNDDLNVATIARQREKELKRQSENEVIVPLH